MNKKDKYQQEVMDSDGINDITLEAQIYYGKALLLYSRQTQLDKHEKLDAEKFNEWLEMTPVEQIEAQHLPTEHLRWIQSLNQDKSQVIH